MNVFLKLQLKNFCVEVQESGLQNTKCLKFVDTSFMAYYFINFLKGGKEENWVEEKKEQRREIEGKR